MAEVVNTAWEDVFVDLFDSNPLENAQFDDLPAMEKVCLATRCRHVAPLT